MYDVFSTRLLVSYVFFCEHIAAVYICAFGVQTNTDKNETKKFLNAHSPHHGPNFSTFSAWAAQREPRFRSGAQHNITLVLFLVLRQAGLVFVTPFAPAGMLPTRGEAVALKTRPAAAARLDFCAHFQRPDKKKPTPQTWPVLCRHD